MNTSANQYLRDLLQWRKDMDADLRRENNWLAAAGLFWLKKGTNTFGSSRDCDIVFPKQAPRLLGAFEFDGTSVVTLHFDVGQSAELNGQPIQTATVLKHDLQDSPSFVKFGNLCIAVIHRADRVGIRLWDNTREERRTFPPRSWFPIDEKYRISALYTPYPVPVKVKTFNAFGVWEENYMQGYVSFNLGGRTYNLDTSDLKDGGLYIQFTDPTNGETTYPKGRYHYTEAVQEDGRVFLDFNKVFNPPSAFTDFATCTFPPNQNDVSIPIEAGETYSAHRPL
ncbi:MAG TPA: DUF1684 domain-containing protein [Anaerolineales bacterium]|nr:DUF1684 domain-containing protein [Anaerolineales bacterium]